MLWTLRGQAAQNVFMIPRYQTKGRKAFHQPCLCIWQSMGNFLVEDKQEFWTWFCQIVFWACARWYHHWVTRTLSFSNQLNIYYLQKQMIKCLPSSVDCLHTLLMFRKSPMLNGMCRTCNRNGPNWTGDMTWQVKVLSTQWAKAWSLGPHDRRREPSPISCPYSPYNALGACHIPTTTYTKQVNKCLKLDQILQKKMMFTFYWNYSLLRYCCWGSSIQTPCSFVRGSNFTENTSLGQRRQPSYCVPFKVLQHDGDSSLLH